VYQPLGTGGAIGNPTHLLRLDLTVTTSTSLPLQSLDPPLERVTERASLFHEFLQFRCGSLASGFIGGVDGPRVKLGNAVDVLVELFQTVLDGGNLRCVGNPRISVRGSEG